MKFVLSLLCLSLLLPLFPSFVAVPRIDTPPVIDGKVDDPAWNRAAGSILINNENSYAVKPEDCYFRICHDGKNIYLAGVAAQSFLNPVMNRLDSVKTRAGGDNDMRIYRDDTVEFFLKTDAAPDYIHLTINMDGKIFLSRGTARGQSKPLSAGSIKRAAVQGKDGWSFEAAVPLELLPGLKVGETFSLGIFRSNVPKDEYAAWSPSPGNFHIPENWGKATLSGNIPAVQCVSADITPGSSTYLMRFGAGNYQFGGVIGETKFEVKRGRRTWSLQGKASAEGIMQSSVMDSNGGLLWQSGAIQMQAAAKAEFELESEVYQLFVNGEQIKSGTGTLRTDFILPAKNNIIVVEAAAKFISRLTLNGLTVDSTAWLTSDAPAPGYHGETYEPKGWKPYDGAAFSEKRLFRLAVTSDHTLFAPQRPDGKLYLANNIYSSWVLRIGSMTEKPLADYEVNVEMPLEISIPLYDFKNRGYQRYPHEFSDTPGEQSRTLNFKFKDPIPKLAYNWGFHVVNFMIRPDFPDLAKTYPVKVWARGRGIVEYPRTYELHVLPELKAGKMTKYDLRLCDIFRGNSWTNAEMDLAARIFAAVGTTLFDVIDTGNQENDFAMERTARELGMRTSFMHFANYRRFASKILEGHPEYAYENPVHPAPVWLKPVCPLAYMQHPYVKNYLEDAAKVFDMITDDLERGIETVCLCGRCRKFFAERFSLPEIPDAAAIYRQHKDSLIIFQVEMNRKLIDFQVAVSTAVKPDIVNGIYCAFESLADREHYGIEWARYKDIRGNAGYDMNTESIRRTRKALGGLPLICGYLLNTNLYERAIANQSIKGACFHLLRAGGFSGVLIWEWRELDGRGYHALADFARGAAEFEDFLNESNQVNAKGLFTGLPDDAVTLYKHGNQYLALAVNLQGSAKTLTAKLPAGVRKAAVTEYYSGTKQESGGSFKITVPPNDAALILITPQP